MCVVQNGWFIENSECVYVYRIACKFQYINGSCTSPLQFLFKTKKVSAKRVYSEAQLTLLARLLLPEVQIQNRLRRRSCAGLVHRCFRLRFRKGDVLVLWPPAKIVCARFIYIYSIYIYNMRRYYVCQQHIEHRPVDRLLRVWHNNDFCNRISEVWIWDDGEAK